MIRLGFFNQDHTKKGFYISVSAHETNTYQNIEVGDKVSIYGALGRYTFHNNNQRMIKGDTWLTAHNKNTHTLTIESSQNIADILSGYVVL